MISVLAVYQDGVLRPIEPLDLAEGQSVQLSVYPRPPFLPLKPPSPEVEEYARRLMAAKTMPELFAAMKTAPQTDEDDFDIIQAINESRRLTGFRMPDPEANLEESR